MAYQLPAEVPDGTVIALRNSVEASVLHTFEYMEHITSLNKKLMEENVALQRVIAQQAVTIGMLKRRACLKSTSPSAHRVNDVRGKKAYGSSRVFHHTRDISARFVSGFPSVKRP